MIIYMYIDWLIFRKASLRVIYQELENW